MAKSKRGKRRPNGPKRPQNKPRPAATRPQGEPEAARGPSTPPARRPRTARKRKRSSSSKAPLAIVGIVAAVVLVFVLVAIFDKGKGGGGKGLAPAAVVERVAKAPAQAFLDAGAGGGVSRVAALPAGQPPLTKNGLPQLLYVGADYCPYCAAERWALVLALGRFGTFSNLGRTVSENNEPTFSFVGTSFSSQYIAFKGVETQATNLTAEEQALFRKYDAPPYVEGSGGGIPFIDFANRFISAGSNFQPTLLRGLTLEEASLQVVDPKTDLGRAALQAANVLTATICELTGGKPGDVCTQKAVIDAKARIGTTG